MTRADQELIGAIAAIVLAWVCLVGVVSHCEAVRDEEPPLFVEAR